VTGLAINGSTKTIYAATGSGLYYTTNAGGALDAGTSGNAGADFEHAVCWWP
jgi:hypothetical protein